MTCGLFVWNHPIFKTKIQSNGYRKKNDPQIHAVKAILSRLLPFKMKT